MHRSLIQNVFDQMFNRFQTRTQNLEKREENPTVHEETTEIPHKAADDTEKEIEVIDVCDSDDDDISDECTEEAVANHNEEVDDDAVVFLGEENKSDSAKQLAAHTCEALVDCSGEVSNEGVGRERRLSGESVRHRKNTEIPQPEVAATGQRKGKVKNAIDKGKHPPPKNGQEKVKLRKSLKRVCKITSKSSQAKNTKRKIDSSNVPKNCRTNSLEAKASKSIKQAKSVLNKAKTQSKAKIKNNSEVFTAKRTNKSKRKQEPKSKKSNGKNVTPKPKMSDKDRKVVCKPARKRARSKKLSKTQESETGKEAEDTKGPKQMRLFDVIDDVFKSDADVAVNMTSFFVPSTATTQSMNFSATPGGCFSLFGPPCQHRGNSIVKEN